MVSTGTVTSEVEQRVRNDFGRQAIMRLLGARLSRIEPGLVEIELPFRPDLAQQHGFFHAGALGAIADSAGGYAAMTMMAPGMEVLTVEYKLNLLRPAAGSLAVARGRVIRSGATLSVCELEVTIVQGDDARSCAWGLQTIIGKETSSLRPIVHAPPP